MLFTCDLSKPQHHKIKEFTLKHREIDFKFSDILKEEDENKNFNCPKCDSNHIVTLYNLNNNLCKYCFACKHGLDNGYIEIRKPSLDGRNSTYLIKRT